MCRHRRFGNLEVTRQFACAQRSRAKQGKDPAPRWICQSSKNIGHIPNLAKYRNTVKPQKEPMMRFHCRPVHYRLHLKICAAGAALALGLGTSASAQVIPGPLKVTDSGPGVSPSGFAIKGITSYGGDSAVFGYGTAQLNGAGIDGVTGYVESSLSVGVVGWSASTASGANASYGVYGYSGTGNGVYGQSNSSSVASIYGVNNVAGGTAMYGFSVGQAVLGVSSATNGVVGVTQTASGINQAGVMGVDNSTTSNGNNYGVAGVSNSATGTGVFGQAQAVGVTGNGFTGVVGQAIPGGDVTGTVGVAGNGYNGVVGQATYGLGGAGVEGTGGIGVVGNAGDPAGGAGVFASGMRPGSTGLVAMGGYGSPAGMFESVDVGDAVEAVAGPPYASAVSLGLSSGEAGAFYGSSGSAQHPALVAQQNAVGTDYFATINASPSVPTSEETFAIQASTANYSGYAVPNYGSDVQVSGDLYVQGAVYQLCSSNAGAFPVTSPHGHCYASVSPAASTKTSTGAEIGTYPTQQSTPTMEDFGEAQLVNGEANVPLERTFASTIDQRRSYLVFVTPEGDCNGLYITGKSTGGFVVRELKGGRSAVAFQYRIVAHPYANNAARLPVIAAAATPGRTSISSHIAGPHMFKLTKLPQLARIGQSPSTRAGHALRAPKLGTLPRRLPPPTVSASLKR